MSHTRAPWKVYTEEHPGRSFPHVERRIGTEWDHGQLKSPYPVVTLATGVGPTESDPVVQFVNIEEDDAKLIAAAPYLLEALKLLVSDIKQGADPISTECRMRTLSWDKALAAIVAAEPDTPSEKSA